MPMPRLRTGGAEAAVSEAFGGGGRWVEAGRRTGRRGHGADGEAVRRKGRRTQCEKTRGRGAGETVRRRRKAHRRLHAGDTLVRHTLQQADVEVHLVPLDGLRARGEEGSAWCCGAQGRRDVDAVRQRTTPSIFLNGRAADVCHSCGLRRIRLFCKAAEGAAVRHRFARRGWTRL
jgi:hypothetical protein